MTRPCTFLLALSLSFAAATNLHAQDSTSKVTILHSDKISIVDSSRQTIIEGNAAVAAGNLHIHGADKIVLDNKAQTLTVYGHYTFTFSGKVQKVVRQSTQPPMLEYAIGDNTVYLK